MSAFLAENVFWLALAGLSAGGVLWTTLRGAVASLDPSAAALFVRQTGAVFLDVRGGEEFASGHIAGAKNIPESELGGSLDKLGKYKDKGVVVVCANGMHSRKAAGVLSGGGFGNLRILAGGMAAWREAQLPTGKGRR